MFNLVLWVDTCEDELEKLELGKMSVAEIKAFEEMIKSDETYEGYMHERTQFCIKEKAFYIFLA